MPSKGVTDRQRVAKALVAAARTHAQEVGERLQEVLAPAVPEGESLPDLAALQNILAHHLEMRIAAIVAADEAHLVEQDDDLDPRRRRDQAAENLHSTLVKIRAALSGAFGRDTIRELAGLQQDTALEPVVLLRQAHRVLERLREPFLGLPEAQLQGVQVDFGLLADQLQPDLDNLTRAVEDVDRELRETETSLRLKDQALDAFDAAVAGIGRILAGFDFLAGFSRYADKVRLRLPSRRRRNTEGDDESPPPEDAPPPQGPPEGELPPGSGSFSPPVESSEP